MYAHEVSPPRSLTSSHWPVGESPVMHIVIMHPHALALFRPGPHPPRPPRPPLSVPCAPASRHRNPLHHISRGKTINAMCSRCTVKALRRYRVCIYICISPQRACMHAPEKALTFVVQPQAREGRGGGERERENACMAEDMAWVGAINAARMITQQRVQAAMLGRYDARQMQHIT